MITRIARGDVVRLIRTGEVGTVVGIVEHDELETRGTLLDVQVAKEKKVTANGNALEFVAHAKLKSHPAALAFVVLLTIAVTSLIGWALVREGTGVWFAVSISVMLYPTIDRTYAAIFLRRRIKVRLPKNRSTTERRTAEAEQNLFTGGPSRVGKGRPPGPSTYHV